MEGFFGTVVKYLVFVTNLLIFVRRHIFVRHFVLSCYCFFAS